MITLLNGPTPASSSSFQTTVLQRDLNNDTLVGGFELLLTHINIKNLILLDYAAYQVG